MPRKYVVSVISTYSPVYAIFNLVTGRGLQNAIKIAEDAGYAGIQLLPLRGIKLSLVDNYSKQITSVADAFNWGSLWSAFASIFSSKYTSAPTVWDLVAFQRELSPFMPSATHVLHHFYEPKAISNAVVEPHPELATTVGPYLAFARRGGRFCFDNHHFIRDQYDGGPRIGSWSQLVREIPTNSVGLIHAHITQRNLPSFLRGEESYLTHMLSILGNRYNKVPVVIEVFPPRHHTSDFLAEVLRITKSWMG